MCLLRPTDYLYPTCLPAYSCRYEPCRCKRSANHPPSPVGPALSGSYQASNRVLILFPTARPRRSRIKQQFLFTFRHVEIPGAIRRCPIQAFCCRSGQDTAVARNVLPHPAVAGNTLFEDFGTRVPGATKGAAGQLTGNRRFTGTWRQCRTTCPDNRLRPSDCSHDLKVISRGNFRNARLRALEPVLAFRSENPMTMTFTKRSVKWLWTAGIIVIFGMMLLLWWHAHNAQTFAQASFFSTRLGLVSALGSFWSIAGGILIKRLK
jgi:hypothetical protein